MIAAEGGLTAGSEIAAKEGICETVLARLDDESEDEGACLVVLCCAFDDSMTSAVTSEFMSNRDLEAPEISSSPTRVFGMFARLLSANTDGLVCESVATGLYE